MAERAEHAEVAPGDTELRCPTPAPGCVACEGAPTSWRDGWPSLMRSVADVAWPLPEYPQERFPQCILELRRRLSTTDESLADELLADAESLTTEVDARVTSVQARAATLQGAAALAATFALAGASLALGTTNVPQHSWRIIFGVGLALLVVLLTASAFRALGASSRVFTSLTPSDEDIFERAKLSAPEAKTRRAAYLLQVYGFNNEVAALRVGYLKAAAFWFRCAISVLVVLMAAFVVYVVHP